MYEQTENKIQTLSCQKNMQSSCCLNQINAIEIFLDLTDNMSFYESCSESQNYNIKNNNHNNNIDNNNEPNIFYEYELTNNFQKINLMDFNTDHRIICQKQNQIKNILNGFKNHIEKTKDPQLKENYCQLYQSDGINFTNLKKIVMKRIKDKKTRWNMKLKSFLQSIHLKPVFYYYLKYESIKWLKNSKVQEKSDLFDLIQKLITFSQNDQILDEIKTYKK